MPAGTVLSDADLRVDHVPRALAQPGALATATDAVGRRVGAGLARGESLTASRLVPRGALDGLPAGRVALHVVSADPAAVDLLAPGLAARVYPAAGGPALAVGATVLAADPASRGGTVALTDAPPRGVVLSLSAAEADAVLSGHGSLDGPVTVTVVAVRGVTGWRAARAVRVDGVSAGERRAAPVRARPAPALGCWRGTASHPTRHRPSRKEPP